MAALPLGTTDAEEGIMFHGFALDEKLPAFEDLLLDTLKNPTYHDMAHLDTLLQMVCFNSALAKASQRLSVKFAS